MSGSLNWDSINPGLGSNLEFMGADERSERFDAEDDADKLFANPAPNNDDDVDVDSLLDFSSRGRGQNPFFSFSRRWCCYSGSYTKLST